MEAHKLAAVLFDEPLTVIDPALKWELRSKLKVLHRALDLTMIYVTHDQTEALTFADTVVVMHEGIGVQVSHPSEIPGAIEELTRNERVYRERCLSFATQEVIREQQGWENLVRALSNKIDLRKGMPQQAPAEIKGVRFGGRKRVS